MRTPLRVSAVATACASLSLLATVMPRPLSASAAPKFQALAKCEVVGGGSITVSSYGFTAQVALEGTIRYLVTNVPCTPGTLEVSVHPLL